MSEGIVAYQALIRDNHRCMVTGRLDSDSFTTGLTTDNPGEVISVTNCCHIFPDSLGNIVADASGPTEHESATVRTILARFGYEDICEELGLASTNANLHRLENVMTLDIMLRNVFDRLNMWFEAIDGQENTYKVVLAGGAARLATKGVIPEQVTFTSHKAGLQLPSPKYLRVHAACCKIAHMSGAAEYLDMVYGEMEELKVLAHDGTSADVLCYAIHDRLAALT
ncbi:hypothetical protein ONZ51_g7079 [Trametes cubensis]|uniref:HNH nuclease domain-containing protein n=1 Tax=Trametes cubensis TaxID=1111947 RepID=A0AAD7XC54_9APHY|nr:hypothetical protein ONZ51_g7079 [Trametes cubensis]